MAPFFVQGGDAFDACRVFSFHPHTPGAGSYWQSLPGLARGHRALGAVFALDWPGVGMSSRPAWTAGRDPTRCEAFFVARLEAWRDAMGVEKFHLVAHSMAACFAVAYAEQHPGRLETLILASPAGVPPPADGGGSFWGQVAAMPLGPERLLLGVAGRLWEAGGTPQAVVRGLGPWVGKRLAVDRYVRHFLPRSLPAKRQFAAYMHAHWQGPPCGEKALGALFRPWAEAKAPLGPRLEGLTPRLPVALVYGRRDWMDVEAAKRVQAALEDDRGRYVVVAELAAECGHQLHLEAPEAFTAFVLQHARPRSEIALRRARQKD